MHLPRKPCLLQINFKKTVPLDKLEQNYNRYITQDLRFLDVVHENHALLGVDIILVSQNYVIGCSVSSNRSAVSVMRR